MASYLGETPEQTQKTAVYLLAFLIGFVPPTPIPQSLPAPGNAEIYVSVWDSSEYSIIDSVNAKFVLTDSESTRFSVNLFSFLLGLQGH